MAYTTPPPVLELSRHWILTEKNYPQNFFTKRAIYFAEFCNKLAKEQRLCQPTTSYQPQERKIVKVLLSVGNNNKKFFFFNLLPQWSNLCPPSPS